MVQVFYFLKWSKAIKSSVFFWIGHFSIVFSKMILNSLSEFSFKFKKRDRERFKHLDKFTKVLKTTKITDTKQI